jgi:hypothetical protein
LANRYEYGPASLLIGDYCDIIERDSDPLMSYLRAVFFPVGKVSGKAALERR